MPKEKVKIASLSNLASQHKTQLTTKVCLWASYRPCPYTIRRDSSAARIRIRSRFESKPLHSAIRPLAARMSSKALHCDAKCWNRTPVFLIGNTKVASYVFDISGTFDFFAEEMLFPAAEPSEFENFSIIVVIALPFTIFSVDQRRAFVEKDGNWQS